MRIIGRAKPTVNLVRPLARTDSSGREIVGVGFHPDPLLGWDTNPHVPET
jgi:hypothetical protein